MPPPRRSNTGLFAGLGVGGVIAIVICAYLVLSGLNEAAGGGSSSSSSDTGMPADTSSPQTVVQAYVDGWTLHEATTVQTAMCKADFDAYNRNGDFESNMKTMFNSHDGRGFTASAGPITNINEAHARVQITITPGVGATPEATKVASIFSTEYGVVKEDAGWKVCRTAK